MTLVASVVAYGPSNVSVDPYVQDDWWVIDYRRPLNFAVNHNDLGDVYFKVTSQAAHGTAWWGGYGEMFYTPADQSYTGSDSVQYTTCHNQTPTGPEICAASATVSIYIIGVDKAGCGSAAAAVGEPVNVMNGNMWLAHVDYSLPGIGEAIQVRRFYNSSIQSAGLFGVGFSTAYDEYLTIYDDRMVVLNLPDARAVIFGRQNTTSTFRSIPGDFRAQMTRTGDGSYSLNYQDGRIHKFDATGRLLWQRDRNGNQTTLARDTNGYLVAVTDGFNRTLTFMPNTNGTISQISDSLGVVADYEYYLGTAELKTVTYSDGSKYKFEYVHPVVSGQTRTFVSTVKDAADNILETHLYDSQGRAYTSEIHGGAEKYTLSFTSGYTTVTDILGRTTRYFFDNRQGRSFITSIERWCSCGTAGNETTLFQYDPYDLFPTRVTNTLGQNTDYEYNATGNVTKITDLFGIQKFTYNSFGEILTYKDRVDQGISNNTTVLAYDSAGNLTSYTDALGRVTTIQYPATNNKGQPEWIKDARNNTTKFKWFAASGLLEEIEDPYTKKTKFTYDARGRAKTVTNALSHVTTYNYFDDTQRKVEMIYPNSDMITYKYDIRRTLESVTDERGKITAYEFDPQYRLKKITDPLGHIKEFGYDLMSNITAYIDPLGKITNYEFDDFDRLKKIIHPAATSGGARLEERLEYDKLGRTKKYYDTADRVTEYTYNDTTRTNTVTNAELETTTVKYNQRFQTFEVRDAINQVYTFSYDPLGRMLSQTRAGGTMTFEYNEVGDVKKRIDYMGRETKYTHDNLNRLTEIEYLPTTAFGTTFYTPNQKSIYGYDDISRLTTATNEMGTVTFGYDNRNRTTSTTDVFGHAIVYEYERTPTVNQRRLKFDGAMYATYNYDNAERLSNIVNSSDSSVISFGYDNEDKITSRAYPNGVTTSYQYFDNDLLKRITDANTSTTLFDRQYLYNSARQISQIIEPTRSRTFGHDNTDRLTSVTDATHGNESYSFDDVGNRTSSHRSATYGYQSGHFNRLTSTATATYQFDANGNTVQKTEGSNFWRYTWDYENRLGEASTRRQKVRYKFDALGRRVQRYIVGNKENTKFIHDGEDVLIDDNAGTLTKYVNGEGIDNKLRQTTGSTASYFLADHLGSTNGLADASGSLTSQTAYDSFGNQSGSLATRYGFTGREGDDFSGLMYYRARSYDPNLGRFVSEDRIGLRGGLNLYGYASNQPLVLRDPSGNIPIIPVVIVVTVLIVSSPSYVNAPAPGDPVYDSRNYLLANAVAGSACSALIGRFGAPLVSKLLGGAGDDVIELGISGGPLLPKTGTTFLGQEAGPAIPIPAGAIPGPVVNPGGRVTGFSYTGGSGGHGMNPRVTGVRIMDPTPVRGASPGYPNGNVTYMNQSSQAVHPYTGQTLVKSSPWWHIPLGPVIIGN